MGSMSPRCSKILVRSHQDSQDASKMVNPGNDSARSFSDAVVGDGSAIDRTI